MGRTRKADERREIVRLFKKRAKVPFYIKQFVVKEFQTVAFAHPLRHGGWWCDECGGRFEDASDKPYLRCPHCGATLQTVEPKTRSIYGYSAGGDQKVVYPKTYRQDRYIKELTSYLGKWQLIKEYFVTKHSRMGEKPTYEIYLIYSHWMNPETRNSHILTRGINMMNYYGRTPFALHSTFRFTECRGGLRSWFYGWEEFTMRRSVLPYYLQHGFDPDSHNEEYALRAYTADATKLETLKKIGQTEAAIIFIGNEHYRRVICTCWQGILVALRHKYDIPKIGWRLWLDYLWELWQLHLDWHSPHYLCPTDFFAAHAATSKRVGRLLRERARRMEEGRERRRLEDIAKMREADARSYKEFENRIAKFIPLTIVGAGLVIKPLATVNDFFEEGTAMRHCVYSNRYYARPECLILSARTDEGKRVETIEVNLDKYNIVQSRGVCNKPTDYHDTIINLVTEAMPQIKRLAHKQTKQTKLIA